MSSSLAVTQLIPAEVVFLFSFLSVYCLARVIYDVFLHPLRTFPGPWMATIGSLYEFYYDVVKDGVYLWEIEKMHQKYGPVVRINSRSLHIHDPEYFSTIYCGGGRKVNKEPSAVAGYTFPYSSIATIDHDLHRRRRAIVSPYFSRRAILSLEPLIHDRLEVLCSRLARTASTNTTIDLTAAFSAYTADVVTYHFYGSYPSYLESTDFQFKLRDALTALLNFYNITRFLPFSPAILKKLPACILRVLDPGFPLVISARRDNVKEVSRVLREQKSGESGRPKSVIVSALTDPSVPAVEKSIDRLVDEGETIIFAGIDTTERTLGVAMFHLLSNREYLERLRRELNLLSQAKARQWTRGVVQEALRLSYGLVTRIPRISTDEALQYQGLVIPAGTPVSQSTYLINNDPSIFPDPGSFDPDRWIRAAEQGVNLDKYMVSFSKGSRGCLGINLSYAMLYLGIARVVDSLEMNLHETTQKDIEVYHTRGFAFPRYGSGSVKARVTSTASGHGSARGTASISRSARLEQV